MVTNVLLNPNLVSLDLLIYINKGLIMATKTQPLVNKTNEEVIELVADKLWNSTYPNGKLIITDSPEDRKFNFSTICNLIGSSGKKLADILNNDELGEVLNLIHSKRVASRVGVLDF